jgi:hypothetical protein
MNDVVKDKLCLKSMEKFGKTLELYLSQNPDVSICAGTGNEDLPVGEAENNPADETGLNNTTRLFGRKRALFNQTCNTLLEGIYIIAFIFMSLL